MADLYVGDVGDTSHAAAVSIASSKQAMFARIYRLVKVAGASGVTCDEVEEVLDYLHQTASARIREMTQAGLIFDAGQRRLTRRGRFARVYVVSLHQPKD